MNLSARGLGLFFVVSGVYGLLCTCMQFGMIFTKDARGIPFNAIVTAFGIFCGLASLVFAIGNLYIGAKMAQLLVTNPGLPLRFTKVCRIFSAISFNIIGFFANHFVIQQLTRLASEAQPAVEPETLT